MIPTDTKSENRAPEAVTESQPKGSETTALTKMHTTSAREDSAAQEEIDQLRKERDSVYERLARLQAEFENARKRDAREQQSFQELALTDAIKSLLPVLDSFDWALQTLRKIPESYALRLSWSASSCMTR